MPISQPNPGIYTHAFSSKILTAFSGRNFPESARGDFFKQLSLSPDSLVRLKQVHGTRIISVLSQEHSEGQTEGDALITNVRGVTLGILTADCLPLFYFSPDKAAIGLAHAGWRGLAGGIAAKMVGAFQEAFDADASQLQVLIGPGICKRCYEVGSEFEDIFGGFYIPDSEEKGKVDLVGVAKTQLEEAGLSLEQVMESGFCTACENQAFFSARREGTKERILSVMQIR